MEHGPHPTPIVTTRIGVGLVRTEGNYPSSTRVGLLRSYLASISMYPVPPNYIRAGRDPLLRRHIWGNTNHHIGHRVLLTVRTCLKFRVPCTFEFLISATLHLQSTTSRYPSMFLKVKHQHKTFWFHCYRCWKMRFNIIDLIEGNWTCILLWYTFYVFLPKYV
jgi:hypothetical protein